jgi:hypothetical protein
MYFVYIYIYENRTMKPVKVVLRTGGKRKIRENMEEVNLIR